MDGNRIEFTDPGPYLFPILSGEAAGMLFDEEKVVVIQIHEVILPFRFTACTDLIEALQNVEMLDAELESPEHVVADITGMGSVEMPVIENIERSCKQFENIMYFDASMEGGTARMPFSLDVAATMGKLFSQVDLTM